MRVCVIVCILVTACYTGFADGKIVVGGGCPKCPTSMTDAPQKNSPGTCSLPGVACAFSRPLGDGIDDDGTLSYKQCDCPSSEDSGHWRCKGFIKTVFNVPSNYNDETIAYSKCHLDPGAQNVPKEMKKALESCSSRYGLGINILLNEKGEGIVLGSCNNHCNDIRVIQGVTAGDHATECKPLTTVTTATASTTTVTRTWTADPAIAVLEDKLAALAAKLAEAGEGSVSTEDLQAEVGLIEETLEAMRTRLDDEALESQAQLNALTKTVATQADDIAELKAALAEQVRAFQAFAARPSIAPASGLACGEKDAAACAPSVQSDGNGDLILAAPAGAVSFQTSECEVTDLCKLQREHKSLMDKFDN